MVARKHARIAADTTESTVTGLTPAGRTWFVDLVGADALHQTRRPLLRTCLDWTERRNHLGGALGSALCTQLLQRGWVTRTPQHRAVTITSEGSRALTDLLDLDIQALIATPSR